MKQVTDSQGNRYMVDQEGAILTDAATAPLSGRPHASVENVDYYYNKFGTLLGGGQKQEGDPAWSGVAKPADDVTPDPPDDDIPF